MLRSNLLKRVIANQGGFTPLDLFSSGEQGVWYDPSDLSTLFQDLGGTTPVTSDGDPVGFIQDKSGNGNDATAPTTAKRPVYRTSGGLSWIEFNGSKAMSTSAIDFSVTDEITTFYGITKTLDAIGVIAELTTQWFSNPGGILDRVDSFGRWIASSRGSKSGSTSMEATVTAGGAPETVTYSVIHSILDNLTRLRINQTNTDDATGDKGTGNFANNSIYIGARNESSTFLNGNIYQMIWTSKRCSVSEIENTESFIADKTGITL